MTIREFLLPDLGEGLTEATIVEWKVAVGDTVVVDQSIVDVESAKAVVELPVPYAGVIEELCGEAGDTITLGDVLVRVRTGESADASAQPGASDSSGAVSESDALPAATGDTTDRPEAADAESSEYSGAVLTGYGLRESKIRLRRPEGGRFGGRRGQSAGTATHAEIAQPGTETAQPGMTRGTDPSVTHSPGAAPNSGALAASLIDPQRNSPVMSPLVRREARAAGFDARHLEGSGRGGLVLREDVRRAIAALGGGTDAAACSPVATSCAPQPAAGSDRRIPVEGMRKLVADHMAESHRDVPKATIWLDVDATPLMELRRELLEATGEKFSLTALVARIVVGALKAHPRLNSSFDARAGEIIEHGEINLGIAAQTPRGLTVPVVHGAGQMSLRELREGIGEIVTESKRGNFPPAKLAGGTFTLNNYGGFGVDGASPIINLPQAAMLGLGRLKDRPWVVDGELAVRKVMTVSFVFDHRVCDGDAASAFLTHITDRIEQPVLLHADR